MEIDYATFYACKIIKVTPGFNLKETNFFARWRQHPQNSWNIFQTQITPLFRRPQGHHGYLEKQNYPQNLNLVVWCAKIGPTVQHCKRQLKYFSNTNNSTTGADWGYSWLKNVSTMFFQKKSSRNGTLTQSWFFMVFLNTINLLCEKSCGRVRNSSGETP